MHAASAGDLWLPNIRRILGRHPALQKLAVRPRLLAPGSVRAAASTCSRPCATTSVVRRIMIRMNRLHGTVSIVTAVNMSDMKMLNRMQDRDQHELLESQRSMSQRCRCPI